MHRINSASLLASLILILHAHAAAALGVPFMVKDINPGAGSSNPQELLALGNQLFFAATDGTSGVEPMASGGTVPSTFQLRDVQPGALSGITQGCPTSNAIVSGTTVFFSATTGVGGSTLWRTDGTPGGTVNVYSGASAADLVDVGGIETDRGQLVNLNGTALFIGNDDVNGFELWRSNGTPGGTVLVKDVFPGSRGGLDGSSLVVMGGAVYFAADDGVHAKELWKSDGTASGTVLVRDIAPQFGAFGPSSPAELANIRGTLFFRATSGGTAGTQVWVSDGSEAGTVPLPDVYPGGASQASSFTDVNGTVYFSATDGVHGIELWAISALTVGVEPDIAHSAGHPTLSQSRPNPARSTTRIAYTLPSAQHVRLRLFDMLGRAVRTLEDREQAAGSYEVVLDTRGLSSGVYFYRLETAAGSWERKVLLTR